MRLTLYYRKLIIYSGILLFAFNSFSAGQERYLHFTETDGLPRNITTCLEKDQYGYLWIGTTNGIARYDGKNFYCYKELSGVWIIYLLYDSQNILWVASNKGLFRYNRLTNFFELTVEGFITKIQEDHGEIYFLNVENINKVVGNKILNVYKGNNLNDFCFSKEGIWLGKINDGVKLLSRESGFKKIAATYLEGKYIKNVYKIDDKLFVGFYNGQLFSILGNGKVIHIDINNHYYFKKIVKVGQEIWLATDGYGIIILDKNLNFSRILSRSKNIEASINSNSIYDILPGNSKEIWLASYGAGLTCILPDNLLFQNILPEKGNENSLVANEGVSLFIKEPVIYFGTNYGLSAWNENTRKFKNLSSDKLRKDLRGTKVSAINVDKNNNIWVGTYDGLLGKYTSDYKLLKTYHPSSNSPDEMQQIILLKEVDKSNLLILTQFYSRILLNFDYEKETTSLFELYSKGSNITFCLLNSLRENQQGELLAVIYDKGLFHVNWKQNVLENRLSAMNKRIDCNITDFYNDKKDNYWITTTSNGLLCISKDGKIYKKYSVKEGLSSNTLVRIESVDDRYLWISTISGVCRFDTETGQVLNFNHSDGLPANEFSDKVSAKTNDEKIIFGSTAGFTIIDPSKVNPDASRTEIIISDITFQNQSIRNPEGKQFLQYPLEDTKEISLPYNKNSFSIHFFAKNKSFLKYHNYAYRLIGLEKNWNYMGETNHATYTNLYPGTYTFEIKSTDKTLEGITTRLLINIRSPWYLSWLAYFSYAIIFFTIIYLSVYAYLKRMELKKEKEISEFKIQKEHELTEKKLEFFTNISHDLKTPLTLIDAPVKDLLQSKNLDQEQVNKLMIINRNSKRLYKLITDLLDFRKITQKQYVLDVKKTIISDIITDIYEAFKEECKNKSIEFKCSWDRNLIGFVDAKKIEKILWNLLSNALKFTNKGGAISLSAEELMNEGCRNLKFVVSDKGIGISEKNKNKIFERFYKVQNSKTMNREGTGIGLSIVKELVEMHHGKIQVESTLGSGTTFTIILPSGKESFSDNELVVFEKPNYQISGDESVENLEISLQHNARQKQYNLPGVLVVEDNPELREYLTGHFEKKYKVYQAEDGLEGLKIAKEINPDVILTDVLMPNMNGYEFCKEIRRSFDTSHIPVIMLTANNTIEHQIEGLSTGADAYLTKPFDIKLLDTQINSLLENRKTLRNKFQGIETPENIEKILPQKDIDFILELKLFIEENIMNQDLNVELLSGHFSVSLAQLHRKMKSLLGSTPNNLIKSIRLKKAYKLISEEGMRVSEAAYQAGFSDPNYFTTCFKKEFGQNPSQIPFKKELNKMTHFEVFQHDKIDFNISGQHKSLQANISEAQNINKSPLMLVVEDNENLRNYISNEFKSHYRIITIADGESAYHQAINEIPDIIISEIIIPGIDGLELCRRLKTDERTSHIPIILLTAKNSEENVIEGLENGADDYISKPFNVSILKSRVKNLCQSRVILHNKFIQESNASVKEISSSLIDERFLKKAFEIVEKNIADPAFDVQILSSELGMSRAQLYRKINAVSGQSVNEFIKIIRLKKAAELLLNSNLSISEIVSKVGFNSFAYFTKSFRVYFGVPPSQYKL
jgi:DNA-binding response OmpR family regulator/signal transduction histidine kinase